MERFENKGRKLFDNASSIYVLIFGLVTSIVFWVFIGRGDVYDNWYPLVGHLVASHGALIAIIFYEYMKATDKSFRNIFKRNK